jgi:signal transduction histidine kinase
MKLRTRFSLVLGIVLLAAMLLPILVLYLLSSSGLVEATYVTETHNAGQADRIILDLLQTPQSPLPGRTPLPWLQDRQTGDWLVPLVVADPDTRQPRISAVYDPVNGLWTGLATNGLERIVLTSRVFQFRVDLPAWLVIGSLPLIGLLTGLALSVVMSRSITRPVSQLAEAAKAIGQHNLGHRVRAKGSREIAELTQSFNRMAEDLERAETTRRNLMADVAHELRTPLTVLEGNLRALLDGVRPLGEDEVALLYEQTHHLNRLVDDLRELSLAEADQLTLDLAPTDLGELVHETVAHFELVARERDIELSSESSGDPVHPALDGQRVRQVLHNLLSNAIQHTPGGGRVHVAVMRLEDGTALEIAVTDTGEGISPADLPHVFDRFYRTDQARARDRGGTGLGLAIARAIVEALGGTILAESPGAMQGSTFVMRLPWNS